MQPANVIARKSVVRRIISSSVVVLLIVLIATCLKGKKHKRLSKKSAQRGKP